MIWKIKKKERTQCRLLLLGGGLDLVKHASTNGIACVAACLGPRSRLHGQLPEPIAMLSLTTCSNGNAFKTNQHQPRNGTNQRKCQLNGISNPSQRGPRPLRNLHGPLRINQPRCSFNKQHATTATIP